MAKIELGEIIATREYGINGETRTVLLEIGKARPYYDEGDYLCPFRITGLPERAYTSYAVGIDPIQALFLAFRSAGTYLYTSQDYSTGRLYWLEPENRSDLGLPHPDEDWDRDW